MRSVHLKGLLVLSFLVVAGSLSAQTTGSATAAQSRTRAIAASFTKFKNVSKEKHGVKKEKYLRVETEPVVRVNPADYSGVYEVPGMAFGLNLSVDRNGLVTGSGYEPLNDNVRRSFTLRNGRIQGALLTATKVYAGGESERLEGAFMNRTSFDSPNATGVTVFGLGTIGKTVVVSGNTFDKLFYDKSR
jgi:hypothetical protein